MRTLAVGAEAVVYANNNRNEVIKQRKPKKYRVKELDERLRLFRMRREAKVMKALRQAGVSVPKLIEADEKTATLTMQLLKGRKVRDALSGGNYIGICRAIGNAIGVMHQNGIVHGDLTTSNMILDSSGKVSFIDFGLSMFSKREEDKAVDLHLFRQALESSHHAIAPECFRAALTAYKEANHGWKEILARLEEVEERGKNKHKG